MPVLDGDWCGRGDGNNAAQSPPMAALMRNNYRRATLHHFRLSKARIEIANEYLAPRWYVRKSHRDKKKPPNYRGLRSDARASLESPIRAAAAPKMRQTQAGFRR